MSIKTELFLTDREISLIKYSLSGVNELSMLKEYLKILSTCSKHGEEYEIIEADAQNLLAKIEHLSEEELKTLLHKIKG